MVQPLSDWQTRCMCLELEMDALLNPVCLVPRMVKAKAEETHNALKFHMQHLFFHSIPGCTGSHFNNNICLLHCALLPDVKSKLSLSSMFQTLAMHSCFSKAEAKKMALSWSYLVDCCTNMASIGKLQIATSGWSDTSIKGNKEVHTLTVMRERGLQSKLQTCSTLQPCSAGMSTRQRKMPRTQ